MKISSYRSMWIVVLFDLPTLTKADRKRHTKFRATLLEDGFTMMQWSVYSRHCLGQESAEVHTKFVKANVPPRGEVRILPVTERQYELMDIFRGKSHTVGEAPPSQLSFI